MDDGLREALSRGRLQVHMTVSGEMMVALWHLAEARGLGYTTQAKALLRQALDRTINTDAVQADVQEYRAYRTRGQWKNDQYEDAELAKLATKE